MKIYETEDAMIDLDSIVAIYDGIQDVGIGYYDGSWVVLKNKREIFVGESEAEDLKDAWHDRSLGGRSKKKPTAKKKTKGKSR